MQVGLCLQRLQMLRKLQGSLREKVQKGLRQEVLRQEGWLQESFEMPTGLHEALLQEGLEMPAGLYETLLQEGLGMPAGLHETLLQEGLARQATHRLKRHWRSPSGFAGGPPRPQRASREFARWAARRCPLTGALRLVQGKVATMGDTGLEPVTFRV